MYEFRNMFASCFLSTLVRSYFVGMNDNSMEFGYSIVCFDL